MTRDGRLEGKVVAITGGASGIGAAMARLFVQEGARVAIADLNETDGQALAAELNAGTKPQVVLFRRIDVTVPEDLDALVAQAEAVFGRLDVLCNNAGIGSMGDSTVLSVDQWRHVIEVDLSGVFYGCKAAIPAFRRAGGGVIVNTASISGIGADYGFAAYNAAKAGVINYTRTLALDHAHENIRCNALCPGLVATTMTRAVLEIEPVAKAWRDAIPMRRPGRPEELAQAALFLASDESSYMTGSSMVVDGGLIANNGQPNIPAILSDS